MQQTMEKQKSKYSIQPGEIFGKLTVISYTDRPDKKGEYKCICECGNISYPATDKLKKGLVKSCGCSQKDPRPEKRLPDNMAIKNAIYKNYKSSAKRRNYDFDLPKEVFIKLIEDNCYYCSEAPSKSANVWHIKNYNDYKYNGIDRINNTLGYFEGNCVSCCPHCNMAKRELSITEFKNWIEKIYQNLF